MSPQGSSSMQMPPHLEEQGTGHGPSEAHAGDKGHTSSTSMNTPSSTTGRIAFLLTQAQQKARFCSCAAWHYVLPPAQIPLLLAPLCFLPPELAARGLPGEAVGLPAKYRSLISQPPSLCTSPLGREYYRASLLLREENK